MLSHKGRWALVLSAAIFFAGACKVDTVNVPPPSTGTGGIGTTPANVQVALGSAAIANGGNTTVTATVTDSIGRAVPNATVALSVISATAGSFSPANGPADQNGQLSSIFTAAAAGNDSNVTIRASVTTGSGTISGSTQLKIGSPPVIPTTIAVSLSTYTLSTPPGSVTVTATLTGAASAPVSGATITFMVSDATAGSFTGGTSTVSAPTNASGVATVTFNANNVNTKVQISASGGTLSNSASLTIGIPLPPTAATMNLSTSPVQIQILGQSTVSVSLLSSAGAPVFDTNVNLTITTGAALGSFSTSTLVSSVSVTTNASGSASATFYAGNSSGVVTITATTTTPSGTLAQNVSIVINSDPTSITLSISDPSLINGQTTNVTALVLNAANQPVTIGTEVTFSITYGGNLPPGTLSSTTAFTITTGEAKVTFTADKVNTGPVFVTATAGAATSSLQIIQVDPASAGSLLYVSSEPSIIGLAGSGSIDQAVVTFQVLNSAGGVLANQPVSFEIVSGPLDATLDNSGGALSSGSTDNDGLVRTILHAGKLAGQIMIRAKTTVSTVPLIELSTSAGAITIGGGVPSDRFFSVAISRKNLEGIYDKDLVGNGVGCLGVTSDISAYVADRFGNSDILKGTAISAITDAGAVDPGNVTNDTGYTTMVYRTQDPAPDDVAPFATEPFYVDSTGRTRNPRDGWVSVLVRTGGEEHFIDADGNGNYDLGETFDDKPEPFVDSNDNNLWDTGEIFFDGPVSVPSNTLYVYNNVGGLGNGVWDAKTALFRNVHLVMTGPPHVGPYTTHIVSASSGTGPVVLPYNESAVFYVYVSDVNMNSLIKGTSISASMTGFDQSTTIPPYRLDLVSGQATLPDGLSYGPSVLEYKVTNKNSSIKPLLGGMSVSIDWPAACSAGLTKLAYPDTITLLPVLNITSAGLDVGTVGVAYTQTLAASGGVQPYKWSLVGGSLPTGLSLNTATGEISGTPTTAGYYSFEVMVTDNVGAQDSRLMDITIQ